MSNEIVIGEIGGDGISAKDVKAFLVGCDVSQPMIARIHSEGGEVFEGFAMYDDFKSYPGPKKCIIESAAFSIASYVAMAFDQVEITTNGYLMIHNPWSVTEGDDAEHAKNAMLLAKLKESMVGAYREKTGKSEQEILSIMKNETFFNATEALAFGLVNTIASKPVVAKPFARKKQMPQRVFASLFEADDAGDKREPTKGKPMSESQKPMAASLAEIKAAFPKAKAEFVLKCLERSLPLASVMTEALSALDEENQTLKAQLAKAMEDMNAKAALEIEVEPGEEEMPEEEMASKAKAKRTGAKPIAKSKPSGGLSAKAQWLSKINAKVSEGIKRDKAAALVNRENPGLREQMLDEVNA